MGCAERDQKGDSVNQALVFPRIPSPSPIKGEGKFGIFHGSWVILLLFEIGL